MPWKFEIFLLAAAIFITVATGGCRNVEPTSAELHPAIQRYFDDQLRAAGTGSLFGKEILAGMGLKTLPVHGVEKIACTSIADRSPQSLRVPRREQRGRGTPIPDLLGARTV